MALVWSANGEHPGDAFGFKGMPAGDVNGDGYDDLLVSAPGWGGNAGKVYLYLGSSAGLAQNAAWTATGEHPVDGFGKSLGGAGDVNGDGFGDVYVAAPDLSAGLPSQGRLYIYFGSKTGLHRKPDQVFTGTVAAEVFGDCSSAIGDVNRDGFDDMIVGAYGYHEGRGRAFIYLGGLGGLRRMAGWEQQGVDPGDNLGYSHGGAGDVNGDSYPDVLLGAKFSSSRGGPAHNGQAWLYLGGPQGPSAQAQAHLAGKEEHGVFASRVYAAGDVNGDGLADVVVGAPGEAEGLGRAYAFLGSRQGLDPRPAWSVKGSRPGDALGIVVYAAGDVDKDGYADVLVGATGSLSTPGEARLYRGSRWGLAPRPAWRTTGEAAGDAFGQWTARAGRLNGREAAVFVGAPGHKQRVGKAYIFEHK